MEKRQLWWTFTADVARNEAEGLAKKQAVEAAAKEKAKHDVGAHDGVGQGPHECAATYKIFDR